MTEETQNTRDEVQQSTPRASTIPGGIMAKRIVWYVIGLIEALLVLRFILMLLGANQGNAFVDLTYGISGFFAAPFFTVFSYTPTYHASVLEPGTLFAMLVYGLLGWALGSLFTLKVKA